MKFVQTISQKLASRKVTLAKFELDFVAIFYISLGLGIGLLVGLSGIVANLQAYTNSNVIKDTDTNFTQGTTSNNVVVSGSGAAANLQLGFTGNLQWYDVQWSYRKQITFTTTQASNLTNFPIMVKLTSSNFDFAKAQSAGQDIRFTDSDGTTLLSYEIERWDNPGQTAVIWVKLPQLDGNSTSDYIYMYYGNPAASHAQNAANVWSNGYKAVWHFGETIVNDNDVFTNSVGNTSYNAIVLDKTNPLGQAGVFDKGIKFDGVKLKGMRVLVAPATFFTNATTDLTVEGYVRVETEVAGGYFKNGWILSSQASVSNCVTNVGLYAEFRSSTARGLYFRLPHHFGSTTCQGNTRVTIVNSVAKDEWNYVSATFNGTSKAMQAYLNGVLADSQTWSGVGSPTWSNSDVKVGVVGTGTGNGSEPFPGQIDEIRVSSVVRSADWVKATYDNLQNVSFATYSTEQTQIPSTGTWESSSSTGVIDMGWNGGWGDGTPGSTAFSATVANLGANANIVFQMRVADSLPNLTSASYVNLGTANSGTTFTKTANELNTLGLATATNRYAQIRLTFNSVNQVTNPQLDNFTLYYLNDVLAPEVAISNLQMFKTNGVASVVNNGWTNDAAPYFTWTAATDSESGLRGYCVYLGSDINADPATTKGLLGSSPAATTGTTCEFMVTGTSIDFANLSLRGGTWLSTSTQSYYIKFKPVDNAGNIAAASTQFAFRFDNTKPNNPQFISLPGDFISTKSADMTWPVGNANAASDAHSGVLGLQYKIGTGGTWYGDNHNGNQDTTDLLGDDGFYTTDPVTDYPNIVEGSNLIFVRTWDVAGNVSDIYVSGALKVNTVAPSAPTNLQVTPGDNTVNSYSFSWDLPNSYTGQSTNITYCYTVNIIPSQVSCSYTAAGVTSLVADAYANTPGTNTMFVSARDEAGNINYAVYASVDFTYSGSAPSIPLNLEVLDISVKADSLWRLVVSWDVPTNVGAGISNYEVYRKTGAGSCSSGLGDFVKVGTTAGTSYADTGLTQQLYSYCVKACDSANSCSAVSQTRSGFPDGKFDTPAELVGTPTISNVTTTRATINWATARNSDSRVAFGLRSGEYFPEEPSRSVQTTDHSISLNNLRPGTTYYIQAKWVDEDGNIGVSSERVFQTLPAPIVQDVRVGNIGVESAVLEYTSFNASSIRIYYGLSTGFGNVVQSGAGGSGSRFVTQLVNLQDGARYFYRINPIDVEGNEYTGTVLEFNTVPRPRISNLEVTELKGESQPTLKVNWETNVETNSVVRYYRNDTPAVTKDVPNVEYKLGPNEQIVRGLEPNAVYTLELKVRDKLGNEVSSRPFGFQTGEDSRPPKIENLTVEGSIVEPTSGSNEPPTAQLIVSWETDEPATSQVEYGEGTNAVYTQKSFRDAKLTYNHIVVISKLTPSKVYSLRVVSDDVAGNQAKSVDTVTITPKSAQTAIEIVIRNLSGIFGFL